MITPDIVRTRFPEFCDDCVYEDDRIQMFIDDTVALYMGEDEERWCNKYDIAQAYLTAHLLTTGTASEAGDSAAKAGNIASKSAGGVSVSRNVATKDRSDADDFFASTTYGQQYMVIRNSCFIGVLTAT